MVPNVVLVPVDHLGIVDLQRLEDAVDDETLLVTVMAANNETGVLAPLPQIAEIAHARGAVFIRTPPSCLHGAGWRLTLWEWICCRFLVTRCTDRRGSAPCT